MRKLAFFTLVLLLAVVGAQAEDHDSFFAGASGFTATNHLTIDGNSYNNFDSGWFRNDGVHQSGNTNYITGYCAPNDCGGFYYHGYFSFDLTGFGGGAANASATIYSYLIQFDPGTYLLYGTSLNPAEVDSSKDWNDIGKYNALIAGPLLGSIAVSPADSSTNVIVSFTPDGLAWLNANAGHNVVVGADFSEIPEPGTMVLLGTGILGIAGAVRRKLF